MIAIPIWLFIFMLWLVGMGLGCMINAAWKRGTGIEGERDGSTDSE